MAADLRFRAARGAMQEAAACIRAAEEAPDPVRRRRLQVQAARTLREAADALDDEGRLTD